LITPKVAKSTTPARPVAIRPADAEDSLLRAILEDSTGERLAKCQGWGQARVFTQNKYNHLVHALESLSKKTGGFDAAAMTGVAARSGVNLLDIFHLRDSCTVADQVRFGSAVSFVFQNFSLIPYYTVLENVTIPLVVAKMSPHERRELAKEYLKLVGLETKIHQRANELSGGERQRVAIARALVNRPKIIIADEPTGSLDSARGNEIMSMLETLSHKRGITVLMVTHDPKLAARADRSIHIQDGHMVKEESHANR